jgi:hypothetical protein
MDAKRKAGRPKGAGLPPEVERREHYNVTLQPSVADAIRALGAGSLSRGIDMIYRLAGGRTAR